MKTRRLLRVIWCLIISGATTTAAPRIERVEPMGVVPGARTILTFSGSGLDSVSNLWTSFGAETERVANTNAGRISFAVRCPATASGIQAMQLIGTEGASGFQLIMIDHLKALRSNGDNRSAEKAMKLAPPIAVDAVAKSEEADYYRISCKAGQTYSIEAIAHRIGSQMDPVVRVLDEAGKELQFFDDEGGVWKDARFRFTAPVDGDFLIAVHDVGYGGGSDYEYRLRVSNDPLVWFTFPLVDSSATVAAFEPIGAGVSAATPSSPANPPAVPLFPNLPQLFELEPNDSRDKAQRLSRPVLLNGKIQSAGDVDYFRFNAEKDQKLIFQSQTRSLGSPCDLILRVLKSDGKVLAESDAGKPDDAAVTNKFTEPGEYLLEVRELSGASVSNAPYRILADEFAPGFTIGTENNVVEIKPGESAKLKFTATRYDYDGPIDLAIEPPVEGITLEKNVLPEKKNEVELTLKAKADLAPGLYQQVSFIGKSTNETAVKVSTRPALRKAFPLMLNSPPMLDGVVTVATRSK
jgi:hypothetical protein